MTQPAQCLYLAGFRSFPGDFRRPGARQEGVLVTTGIPPRSELNVDTEEATGKLPGTRAITARKSCALLQSPNRRCSSAFKITPETAA